MGNQVVRKLLIVCQKVDDADDLLGFFGSWLREFARRYEHVTVIALGAGQANLPPNVRVFSLGKERGVQRWKRWLGMLDLLRREVPRHDAVFCHMSPVFPIIAAPFTKAWHKRLVLWYLHRSNTLRLRIALRLIDALVTADERSLSVRSPKIHAVGHGIDVGSYAFPERQPPSGRPLRILSVGRLSPIKGFETLIRAAAKLREGEADCEVRIIGKAVMPGDRQYEYELRTLVARLEAGDIVHFFGFVPHRDMPAHYRWADVVVNCAPPGGIDKVLLEGMAAGCIPLTSNTVMRGLLADDAATLIYPHGDSDVLADRIASLNDFEGMSRQMSERAGTQTVTAVIGAITAYL